MREMQMFKRISLLAFVLALMVSPGQAQQASGSQAAPPPGTAVRSATDDPNYVIGPQDVLDISVWKEPELTRTVPVRPDGKISLPLLNDVQASGLTPSQLTSQITVGLGKFMNSPQVTVIVTAVSSQRIYILGEVMRPGAYVMIPGMTVLQAISNGGGLTQFANRKKIYVLRNENGKQEKHFFNYNDVIKLGRTDEDIQLKSGDTIVVP
jgi:polysaccharide export outer membrane protein